MFNSFAESQRKSREVEVEEEDEDFPGEDDAVMEEEEGEKETPVKPAGKEVIFVMLPVIVIHTRYNAIQIYCLIDTNRTFYFGSSHNVNNSQLNYMAYRKYSLVLKSHLVTLHVHFARK